MRFAYYRRLSSAQKAIYRKSDEVTSIAIPNAKSLRPLAQAVVDALGDDDRVAVQATTSRLTSALLRALRVRPLSVRVLAVRPRSSSEELHGLYVRDLEDERARPVLQVWMRTAAHRRAVAPRTYLRTLFHEICHHLDYELLGLNDSFHTEGFFRRESSLTRQLAPGRGKRAAKAPTSVAAPVRKPSKMRPRSTDPALAKAKGGPVASGTHGAVARPVRPPVPPSKSPVRDQLSLFDRH